MSSSNSLKINSLLESEQLSCGSIHKIWGMVQLTAESDSIDSQNLPIDFIVAIDHSSSMRMDNKLSYVKATIEYMLSQLNVNHRFCLIGFNHEITNLTNGLQITDEANKQTILQKLTEITAQGSTNIGDALFQAFEIIQSREDQTRLPTIFLFTDGLSNCGSRGQQLMDRLKQELSSLPRGLTVHTFGYGQDQDSQMLRNISFCFPSGTYYYIENTHSISATFAECLSGLFSLFAQEMTLRLIAKDGCRIVSLSTPLHIIENQSVKDYTIEMGHLYAQESRTLLFKLSLRKMPSLVSSLEKSLAEKGSQGLPLVNQDLCSIQVQWKQPSTGNIQVVEQLLSVQRLPVSSLEKSLAEKGSQGLPLVLTRPIELDQQINRLSTALAIESAINQVDLMTAQKEITDAIDLITSSPSASQCQSLILDLLDCLGLVTDSQTFSSAKHRLIAYATQHLLERSTGTSHLSLHNDIDTPSQNRYSYLTNYQQSSVNQAITETNKYVTKYI